MLQSTGIPTLDAVLAGGLAIGDNVILLGRRADVAGFVDAFIGATDPPGRLVTPVRSGSGRRVSDMDGGHPGRDEVAAVVLADDLKPGSRMVVDGLDPLAVRWGITETVAFYSSICPQLFDLGAVAYWTGSREMIPSSAVDQLTRVAQVVLEVADDRLKILKAEGRPARLVGAVIDVDRDPERPVLTREHTVGRVGEGIRRVRRQRGMTQLEMGRLAGVTPAAISQAETGRRGLSLDTLVPLCDALGMGVDDLLGNSAADDYQIARRGHGEEPHRSAGAVLPGLRIHLVRLPPGGSGRPPFIHKGREVVLSIEGLLMVELDDASPVVRRGDALTVIRSVMRRWTNLGSTDASFFWLALEASRNSVVGVLG